MSIWNWIAPKWLTRASRLSQIQKVPSRRARTLFLEDLEDRATPSVTQFLDPNPNPGNQFGAMVVPLSSGNVVVTSPFDDAGGTDAGAVYLFNGTTGALISTLTGSRANDNIGKDGVFGLSSGNFVVRSLSWDNGSIADAGAVTWGSGTKGVSGTVSSANSLVGSKALDRVGSGGITVLPNGNYVVLSPAWDNADSVDAGAATFGNGSSGVSGLLGPSNSMVGGQTNDTVGSGGLTVLTNNNVVVISPNWNQNGGAATWINGASGRVGVVSDTNSLVGNISSFVSNYFVGSGGVVALTNGNYVIVSPKFLSDRGAVTWGDGATGLIGVVNETNSLVGEQNLDSVGSGGVVALTNGNYVISSPEWDNTTTANVGAVTWGSGATGRSGKISSSNSLIGSTAQDKLGSGGVFKLTNGNYVVSSPLWENGSATDAGAATWGSGTTGITGTITAANSLVGSSAGDMISMRGVLALDSGNYVVSSPTWDNGGTVNAGAVTWGSGSTGVAGTVSAANSLVGGTAGSTVGSNATVQLSNGNYVVQSPDWNSALLSRAGAITWASGTTGITGVVDSTNSLVGGSANDNVGSGGVVSLGNGNFVVSSPGWDNGSISSAGAVTWGNGKTGLTGTVSSANSLVGTTTGDQVGLNGIQVLTNGNYLVKSSFWDNGTATEAGAVTWGSGTSGVFGSVTSSNSLVGAASNDRVGAGPVVALTNGNYVVGAPEWDNGSTGNAGAVAWGDGAKGTSGTLGVSNSLVGGSANDSLSSGGITPLANGNYAVNSPGWDNGSVANAGAVTVLRGTLPTTGTVGSNLSLVGTSKDANLLPTIVDSVNGAVYGSFPNQTVGGVVLATTQSPQPALITSANQATFLVGTQASFTITATGNPTPTLTLTGTLPQGITFNPATGVLSGTAALGTGGVYPLTIQAENKVGSGVTQNFTLTINETPSFTSADSTTFLVGSQGTFTVSARGFPAPTFSTKSPLPTGVTLSAAGVLSGTPAANTGGSYSIVIEAANGIGTNPTQTFTLRVNQPPAFTSGTSTTFTTGTAGSFTVSVTGFPVPTLSLAAGTLPSGVTFNTTTGVLSGTPAASAGGIYNLTFQASNGVGNPISQNFTLTVNQPPVFTSPDNAAFSTQGSTSFTVTATGFPNPTLSLIAGTLPSGITFTPATGILSGTAAKGVGGNFPLKFQASTGVGTPATQDFTLVVSDGPVITSPNRATFIAGTPGTFTFTASGFPAPSYSILSGTLPSGLTLNGTTGVLSGTPAADAGGFYPLVVEANNGVGIPGKQNFTLAVNQSPVITSANNTTFLVGTPGSFTITSTGFPARTYSITAGKLPTGLTLNATTGVISGDPATGTGGQYALTLRASNGVGAPASQSFTLTVNEPPSITSENNAVFTAGIDNSFKVTANGYPASTFAITAGTLPAGITFDTVTGLLAGKPTVASLGIFPLTIQASNGIGSPVSQDFTLTVIDTPKFTSAPQATFVLGKSNSFQVTATGFPVPTFSTSSALPSGVTLTSVGLLSGTPAPGTAGVYTIVIEASNGIGTPVPQDFTLTIHEAPKITNPASTAFLVGEQGTFTFTATGFPAPTFSITSGSLPSGVTFDGLTGVLSGTPAAGTIGTYNLVVRASNGVDPVANQNFQLQVNQAPKITSDNSTTFLVRRLGTFTITATGFPTPTLELVSGKLPSGLTFNPTTGVLGGTAILGTGGIYPLVFRASNGVGTPATQDFTLNVNQSPAIVSPNRASFLVGVQGTFSVVATGFPACTFSVASGTLPTGLTLDPVTGVISGTPAAGTTGNTLVRIQASNGVGTPSVQNLTISINQAPAFTSENTTNFTVGSPGSFAVKASGFPSVLYSVSSGKLPTGVTLNAVTGLLAGTPAAGTSGVYRVVLQAANGVGTPATQNFTLNVIGQPTIISDNSTTFKVGSQGSFQVVASAFPPATYQVIEGTLPSGITLNATTGVLSGTAPANSGGIYPIKIEATNGVGFPATQDFTLNVNQAPLIESGSKVTFIASTPAQFTFVTTGYPKPVLEVVAGTLPLGLTLDPQTGILSGTPAASAGGSYALRIRASNGVSPDALQNFDITVNLSGSVAQILDPNPSPGNQFGAQIVPLPSGNVVVTAPLDDRGGKDAGAVYLFDGATGALISALYGSKADDRVGSDGITLLPGGNYLVRSPFWDNGTIANAGAVTLVDGVAGVDGPISVLNSLVGASAEDRIGSGGIQVLDNGNFLIRSPLWDNGRIGPDAGAVTFGKQSGKLFGEVSGSNSLTGSSPNDQVGLLPAIALPSGNFVLSSPNWDNADKSNAGAVTFGLGTTGVIGPVSSANSLVGDNAADMVGFGGVTVLENGNFVVLSPMWNKVRGAVTFGSGALGISGVVSATNSLVGDTDFSNVGSGGIEELSNGNFLVLNYNWNNNRGAVTWADGTKGVVGVVSSANSLVGSQDKSYVGFSPRGAVSEMASGNFVITSPNWSTTGAAKAGASTWGSGTTGIRGVVGASNSLVGSQANDQVGSGGVFQLGNGNYALSSPNWSNGAASKVGAITLAQGDGSTRGPVSTTNSLVGAQANDRVGSGGVVSLGTNRLAVMSPEWANGKEAKAGAVTLMSSATGLAGPVNAGNSLVGSRTGDAVGSGGLTPLGSGAFLISSPAWSNGSATRAGAVTFGAAGGSLVGPVSSGNSLVGTQANDRVGSGGIVTLSDGGYVVSSPEWSNGSLSQAGAVTRGNGKSGVMGSVSSTNSLIGSSGGDRIGSGGILSLESGAFLVSSPVWDRAGALDAGAITLVKASDPATGPLTQENSLVGGQALDRVGSGGVMKTDNGRVLVFSPNWSNGSARQAGAVTQIAVATGLVGLITDTNSLVGARTGDFVGGGGLLGLSNGNYLILSPDWDAAGAANVGAITWVEAGSTPTGVVGPTNSLVGNQSGDRVGLGQVTELDNGNFLITTPNWSSGASKGAGAVTLGDGKTGVRGVVTAANSLVGSSTNDQVGSGGITPFPNGNFVISSPNWANNGAANAGAVTWGQGNSGVVGAVGAGNSQVGSAGNSGLQPVVVDPVNETYLASFLTSPGGGVINLGYQAPTACTITSPNTATFKEGQAGSFQFTGTGAPTPFFTLLSGTLPVGLSLVSNIGLLSGTPAPGTKGTYSLTIQAANGVGSAQTQNFTLVVE